MAVALTDKVKERRNRVLLGNLPDDFLRINISPQQQQEAADCQAAIALHQQFYANATNQQMTTNMIGRLNITVVQAKLTKNYGMTRMDPYARIRVGHTVYETQTDPNGGKNPRWNKVIQCVLPQGINTLTIEIFDERSFTMDELIAWTQILIPQQIIEENQTHEDWYPLNGKQGDGMEGMINLVMSYTVIPTNIYTPTSRLMFVPNVDGKVMKPFSVYTANNPNPDANLHVPVLSESELKQIEEMFPNIDKEVIKTVFEANRGSKDSTINSLLQMAE